MSSHNAPPPRTTNTGAEDAAAGGGKDPQSQEVEDLFKELMFEADEFDRATTEDVASYLSSTSFFKWFDRRSGAIPSLEEEAVMASEAAAAAAAMGAAAGAGAAAMNKTISPEELEKQRAQQQLLQKDAMKRVSEGSTVVQRSRAGAGMNTSVTDGTSITAAASTVHAPIGGDFSSSYDPSNAPRTLEAATAWSAANASVGGAPGQQRGVGAAGGKTKFQPKQLPLANRLLFKKSRPDYVPLLRRWWIPYVGIAALAVIWCPDMWKLKTIYYADYQYTRIKHSIHATYWKYTMPREEYKLLMEQLEAGVPKSLRVKAKDCPL